MVRYGSLVDTYARGDSEVEVRVPLLQDGQLLAR